MNLYPHNKFQYAASGLGDITPLGVLVPPIGLYQGFGGPGAARDSKRSFDWSGVAKVGAVVAVGIVGFFVIRQLAVVGGTLRGAKKGFSELSSNGSER